MQNEKLSSILDNTFSKDRAETTFGELIKELDHHGMAMVLILFSIPSALPIPAAGYSTLLSIPLFVIGARLMAGKSTIWLPNSFLSKSFKPASFEKPIKKMSKFATFLEKFSRPRLTAVLESPLCLPLIGTLIILLASSMALPIPGTNTAPAFGIFVIGFGLLEKDGLAVIAGGILGTIALAISVAIIYFGYEVFKLGIKTLVGTTSPALFYL